jgi:phosphoglycolate phosphatase
MTVFPAFSGQAPFIRTGFQWDVFDAYLFDIDGTLLNSRDAVHYHAFQRALLAVCGVETRLEGLPVHGNTDPGILRAALRRAGLRDKDIDLALPQIIEQMRAEVRRNQRDLMPELCPAIDELLTHLERRGRLLGAASGNIEAIGWAKLERAGLKQRFAFGAFSWPLETRVEIFRRGQALAREKLGEQASICVVGDTPSDIEAARDLGLAVIALATGIFPFEQLMACSPDACLENAQNLIADTAKSSAASRRES